MWYVVTEMKAQLGLKFKNINKMHCLGLFFIVTAQLNLNSTSTRVLVTTKYLGTPTPPTTPPMKLCVVVVLLVK